MNRKVVELFAASGADAWFTPEADGILPAGTKCATLRRHEVREGDGHSRRMVRVGCSHAAVLADEPDYPGLPICISKAATSTADGFSLPCSAPWARASTPPYRALSPPAGRWTRQGQAMSKSRGNDVDPVDIASRLGGEIVRLWVASVDFREDVVGSEKLMQRVARELSQDPQQPVPLCAGQSVRF